MLDRTVKTVFHAHARQVLYGYSPYFLRCLSCIIWGVQLLPWKPRNKRRAAKKEERETGRWGESPFSKNALSPLALSHSNIPPWKSTFCLGRLEWWRYQLPQIWMMFSHTALHRISKSLVASVRIKRQLVDKGAQSYANGDESVNPKSRHCLAS